MFQNHKDSISFLNKWFSASKFSKSFVSELLAKLNPPEFFFDVDTDQGCLNCFLREALFTCLNDVGTDLYKFSVSLSQVNFEVIDQGQFLIDGLILCQACSDF